jgi:type IV secretion system protein TrbI
MRFTFLPHTRRERPVEDNDAAPALRPAPPMAKRLNRNALTLAALIMGMTVLTVIVVLNPSKEGKPDRVTRTSAENASVVPARPAFLDEPVHSPSPNLARAPDSARAAADSATVPITAPVTPSYAPSSSAASQQPVDHAGSDTAVEIAPLSEARTSPPSERERSYRSALASPVIVSAAPSQSARASARPLSTLESEEQQLVTLGDSVLHSTLQPSVAGASQGAPPRADSSSPRVKSRGLQSFANRTTEGASSGVAMEFAETGSPYTLRAGTVLSGLLITGINSELPGEIVGQVSRNVYDSRTQRLLLIPRGARLIGSYDNQIAAGQGRLLVAWTRFILPDGRSMSLPGLALTDREGRSGAKDKVDNHWWRVFGNAVLLSAIGAGVQLSQPAQTSVLSTPSAGQVAAGAVGQELSNVALEILRKGMTVAPTITIRAGQSFNVFLNGDVTFDAPYEPHG